MKEKLLHISFMVLLILLLLASRSSGPYIDGRYNGISRAGYLEEYYGNATLDIENGWITKIDFFVRDSAKHESFDASYEHYFEGNDLYIQQCRNDWKGINSYPDSLLKYQDINKVDAISGATWSYNLFRYSVQKALKNAKKSR
jgi:major membrane immunogen (membrane-anchored lipoprotein)